MESMCTLHRKRGVKYLSEIPLEFFHGGMGYAPFILRMGLWRYYAIK